MTHKDLIVWNKSIDLVEEVYKLTKEFPRDELYGITSQMRRACVAIPSNIAEGYGRKSRKEHLQFYSIAFASALELETQIIISKRLRFSELSNFVRTEAILVEILKMLNKMTSENRTSY